METNKRYDEALARARNFYEFCKKSGTKNTAEIILNIFPELRESKDERIRKTLIEFFGKGAENNSLTNGISDKDILAWLEKQGGQKPADKVEPKFKVGDLIKHNKANIICKVLSANVGLYRLVNILGGDEIELSNVEKNFHLWSIQDAKDGDVLVDSCKGFNNPFIFILKRFEKVDFGLATLSDFSSYCYLTMSDNQKFKDGGYHHMHDICPATKEQRDLLFQKMKEAGYEWDVNEKKLKKIEQEYHCTGVREPKEATGVLKQLLNKENYAWSEEDEAYRVDILVKLEPHITDDNFTDVQNWFKSIKERYLWKPSEEQMDALETAVSSLQSTALESLYQDLKKL